MPGTKIELRSTIISEAHYSKWFQVPSDRNTIIREIAEGKKFQIRANKKIDASNDISWTLVGIGGFTLTTKSISVNGCIKYQLQGTEPFLQKAGEFLFLKSSTKLQIWFDNVLEVTWTFQNAHNNICDMRKTLDGLIFQNPNGNQDKVSSHYKYQIGNQMCVEIACLCDCVRPLVLRS